MTNEQKIIDELREFVDKFNLVLYSYGAVCSGFSMKLKLDELEQKYCGGQDERAENNKWSEGVFNKRNA